MLLLTVMGTSRRSESNLSWVLTQQGKYCRSSRKIHFVTTHSCLIRAVTSSDARKIPVEGSIGNLADGEHRTCVFAGHLEELWAASEETHKSDVSVDLTVGVPAPKTPAMRNANVPFRRVGKANRADLPIHQAGHSQPSTPVIRSVCGAPRKARQAAWSAVENNSKPHR